jgi:hypothetical protein
MSKTSNTLRFILKAMCSEYNGIQVFLYPMTIFYLISTNSILSAFTSLLSLRIYYLPLSFFGVLFIYVGFMVLKIYTCLFRGPHKEYPLLMDEFYESVINLHLVLFITLMILMVYFVLTKFLAYFYAIELPLKQVIMFLFRAFTTLLILYFYLRSMWLSPLRKRGYGKRRSKFIVTGWVYKHPWEAVKYTVMMIVVVISAVRLYVLVIAYFLSPLISGLSSLLGWHLSLDLITVSGIGSVLYNLFMLAAAFALSNLLFYPIISLGQTLNNKMHPMKIKQVHYAKN